MIRLLRYAILAFIGGAIAFHPVSAADTGALEALVEQLKSSDTPERRDASYRLSQLGAGAAEAVPALIEALNDGDSQVWFNSITALARVGPAAAAAVPRLRQELIDTARRRNPGQRWYRTAFALGSIGEPAVPTLRELLEHREPIVRAGAAKAITWTGGDAAELTDMLAARLADEESDVRQFSAEALAAIGSGSIPVLEDALKSDQADTRRAAAHGLEFVEPTPTQSALKVAVALATEPVANVQAQFIHTLNRLHYPPLGMLPLLIERLDAEDPTLRQQVFDALILMDDPEKTSVPALTQVLSTDGPTRHAGTIEVLGAIGPDASSAADAVISARSQLDPVSQSMADDALLQMGSGAVPALVRTFNEHDGDTEHWSADCLQDFGTLAVPLLIVELKAEEVTHRANAARMLARIGPEAAPAIPSLLRVLEAGAEELRGPALEALGSVGASADQVVPPARRALQSELISLRRSGAIALAGIGPEARPALPELIVALNDSDTILQTHAARAIGRLQPPPASTIEPLTKVLRIAPVPVQIEVVGALAAMGKEAQPAVPVLAELLPGVDQELQIAIIRLLGELGTSALEAAPKIELGLLDDSPNVRATALEAFVRMEPSSVRRVAILIEMLQDPAPTVRLAAIRGLGELGDDAESAAEQLYRLTATEDERDAALEVLSELEIQDVPLLMLALNNPDSGVRRFAVDRLGELGAQATAAVPALEELAQTERNRRLRREIENALGEIRRGE